MHTATLSLEISPESYNNDWNVQSIWFSMSSYHRSIMQWHSTISTSALTFRHSPSLTPHIVSSSRRICFQRRVDIESKAKGIDMRVGTTAQGFGFCEHRARDHSPPRHGNIMAQAAYHTPLQRHVDHTYRDFSNFPLDELPTRKRAPTNFPSKLHQILSNPEYAHVSRH